MEANNDTEIVKQSMSVTIATLVGLIFIGISTGMIIYLSSYIGIKFGLLCYTTLIFGLSWVSYIFLLKSGTNIYRKIRA